MSDCTVDTVPTIWMFQVLELMVELTSKLFYSWELVIN